MHYNLILKNKNMKKITKILFIALFITGVSTEMYAQKAEKAEKTDVIRMEDHIEKQIADVKKDLKEDIGEVKKKVDDIYKAVSGGR